MATENRMQANKILLQLGDRRQVVEVQDFKSLEDLNQYTTTHFDVSQNTRIYFQRFESDWNEYVEISDLHDLNNKDKVIAVLDVNMKSTDGDSGGEATAQEGQCKDDPISGLQSSSDQRNRESVSDKVGQRTICIKKDQVVLGPAVQVPVSNCTMEVKVVINPEKLKEDSLIYKDLEPGSFLYQYRKALNDAAYELALEDPSLIHKKGELQSLAKVKLDSDGYGYKRQKSRSQRLSVDEPLSSTKLTPSLRSKRMREVEEDLKEVKLEMTLLEKSRTKARNVNNDDRARHLTQEIAPLRERKRKLEDELTVPQKKEAKSVHQKKKRTEQTPGQIKLDDHKMDTSQRTIDNMLSSGSKKSCPRRVTVLLLLEVQANPVTLFCR